MIVVRIAVSSGRVLAFSIISLATKSLSNFVKEMSFVYDESIWFPDKPETHNNLIEFKVKLYNDLSCLPFRLFINKGTNQEPVLLNGSMMWEW